MSNMKAKVGEWWVCNVISIMGNGDCQSAYKMNAGLIIAGNVKPIERLYTEEECDRLQQENADLREALEGAMKIKDLWLPFHIVANEHEGEAIALHRMYNKFEQLLNKND